MHREGVVMMMMMIMTNSGIKMMMKCNCLMKNATLRWLCVPERVQYKIAVLTFKVFHDSAPRYLGRLRLVAVPSAA